MGVLSCARPSCSNIMCDTYVETVGYVCSECQNEFNEYLEHKNLTPHTDYEFTLNLRVFMETDKTNSYRKDIPDTETFFSHYRHV